MNYQSMVTRHEQWEGFAIDELTIDAFSSLSVLLTVPTFDTTRFTAAQGAGTIDDTSGLMTGGICSAARCAWGFFDVSGGGAGYSLSITVQIERVVGGAAFGMETIASGGLGELKGVRHLWTPFVSFDITETGGLGIILSGWFRVFSGFGAGGAAVS